MILKAGQIWIKEDLTTIEILDDSLNFLVVRFGTKKPRKYAPDYLPKQYNFNAPKLEHRLLSENYKLDVIAMFRRLKSIEEVECLR